MKLSIQSVIKTLLAVTILLQVFGAALVSATECCPENKPCHEMMPASPVCANCLCVGISSGELLYFKSYLGFQNTPNFKSHYQSINVNAIWGPPNNFLSYLN
ncbi:MAG: hypothetical protein IPK77_10315 [Cellvibrio sp.]|nr:hypothetical protein [Cellvibrio sp.]